MPLFGLGAAALVPGIKTNPIGTFTNALKDVGDFLGFGQTKEFQNRDKMRAVFYSWVKEWRAINHAAPDWKRKLYDPYLAKMAQAIAGTVLGGHHSPQAAAWAAEVTPQLQAINRLQVPPGVVPGRVSGLDVMYMTGLESNTQAPQMSGSVQLAGSAPGFSMGGLLPIALAIGATFLFMKG